MFVGTAPEAVTWRSLALPESLKVPLIVNRPLLWHAGQTTQS